MRESMSALVRLAARVLVVGGLCAVSARAEDQAEAKSGPGSPAPEKALTRAESIRQALAAMDAELKESGGGSWKAWAERLEPFRADFREKLAAKHPVKHNFRLDGTGIRLTLADSVDEMPNGRRPFDCIVHTSEQLKGRGIDLIVAFIPDKVAIYPDYLSEEAPADGIVAIQMKRLMRDLLAKDVECVDLYTAFRDARRKTGDKVHLYYDYDRHWRNAGCRVAAEEIAKRLMRYDFVRKALATGNPYTTKPHRRTDGHKTDDVMLVVRKADGRRYGDVGSSPIILTTDSYGMYNMHLKAHLTAQVAVHVGMPLTFLCQQGLWDNMPLELAKLDKSRGYLAGRRVVVWTLIGRALGYGGRAWSRVPIPAAAE